MRLQVSHTQQNGFTLIETLVAITILLLVIIGPMTVAQKGIQNAYYANEQVTAVFLAQEAIEAVRELRDADALDAYDTVGGGDTWNWYGSLPADCKNGNGCAFDVEDNAFEDCGTSGIPNYACVLRIDSDGKYNYEGGGATSPFTRKIFVGTDTGAGGIPVTVDVSWEGRVFGGTIRHAILQTWVYDHYQRYND